MNRRVLRLIALAFVAVLLTAVPWQAARTPFSPGAVYANGFIDFEDGVDGEPIQSTISGLRFTTTAGYDWVYGDWRTGQYNGKYPVGAYSSNGNVFAWLGPNQGDGRIEFIHSDATYLSLYVSADTAVTLQGYDANDTLIATATLPEANTNTGRLDELRIEAPAGQRFSYAIVGAAANQWVIDDLSTDAAGVPDSRTPLIFLPGLAGTRLTNNEGEVWPNSLELLFDIDDDSMLVLRLQTDGETPFDLNDERYTSVTTGDVIRTEAGQDFYQSMIDYFGQRGYTESDGTLVIFPYDWRKDMNHAVADLETVITQVKAQLGVDRVNLLGHSMGGLVARAYIADPERANDIDTMVTLGTPYLGTPRAFLAIHYGTCYVYIGPFCISNEGMVRTLSQNFPAIYQLLPNQHYFRVYPDGYVNMDRDTDGDGVREGWLSYDEVGDNVLGAHNGPLFTAAETFHTSVNSYRDGTNGVDVYVFVGDGYDTPGTVREYVRRKWYWPWQTEIVHDIGVVNGDGTIPLRSADLGRTLGDDDFSGSASYFYAPLSHGELARYTEGRTVLPLVADIFETAAPPTQLDEGPPISGSQGEPELVLPDHPPSPATTQGAAPANWITVESEPTPLTGRQLLVQGSAALEVEDADGNLVRIDSNGATEAAIPGSSLTRIGSTTSVFVPEGGVYQVRLVGQAEDLVDLRLRTISEGETQQTVVYKDVVVDAGTTAHLAYDTTLATPDYQLYIDRDGDGAADGTTTPFSIVGAGASDDTTPPVSSIQVEGTRNPDGDFSGPVTLTLTATDNAGGSGVARIEYSLDGGQSVHIYTEPVTIEAKTTVILVKALDRMGNEQYPLTTMVLNPERVFLPLALR